MTDYRSPRPDDAARAVERSPVIAVDFSEGRSGEDVRQRGWFWHWNELHTEYGPLLRQSGIGLLTSYIVYTDRREHSPQRGYAFPSLQLQAAFTGADRAELITINQILVALDLLEIRKEMVVRADEQGHKWRVPHNLYRVKDKSDSRHLTAADVLRVLDLAEGKREVYRHIRHIFSADFTPISRGNIWHSLRDELRETPIWQRLAIRAERDEAKFSERSRAGHAARRANAATSDTAPGAGSILELMPAIEELQGQVEPPPATGETTVSAETNLAGDLSPATQGTIVAATNQGSATSVPPSNEGLATDWPGSDGRCNEGQASSVAPSNPMYDQSVQTTRTTTGRGQTEAAAGINAPPVTEVSGIVTGAVTGSGSHLSQEAAPEHGPDRAAAVRGFAEANGREASVAEERLLAGIAQEADRLLGVTDAATIASGWAVVAAAIDEAVDSGSSYVAPKRVREIVRRWLREGEASGRAGEQASGRDALPCVRGTEARGWVGGEVLRAEEPGDRRQGTGVRSPITEDPEPKADVRFWVEEGQISSTLLWETIIAELAERGVGRRTDFEMCLRPARFLGRSGERGFRLEAPNQHARRRIELHWRGELERGLARLLGGTGWQIEVSVPEETRRTG